MELTVQIDEGLGPQLYQWLVSDPDVRRNITITPVDEAPSGAMGTGFDLLNLIIPNLIALGNLGVSIAGFIDQRRNGSGSGPEVRARHQGHIVVLGADAEEVLRRLFQDELQRVGRDEPSRTGQAESHGTEQVPSHHDERAEPQRTDVADGR